MFLASRFSQPFHPSQDRRLPAAATHIAEVISIEDIAADTRILRLTLAHAARLDFLAGQYAHLSLEGLDPRAFSIASAPHRQHLEFHVKNSHRGFSAAVFTTLKKGDAVTVEAPFGDHYWRPSPRPLMALAGGVGIAPLKAVIEAQLAHNPAAPVTLYWGVRDEAHLYLDGFFETLAAKNAAFTYIPVIAHGDTARRRSGYIGAAVTADNVNLAGNNIYMAGPAAMVEATLPLLLAQGAEKDFIFSDAFGG